MRLSPQPSRRLRPRERDAAGFVVLLLLAIVVFQAWPALDLRVSAWCIGAEGRFVGWEQAWAMALYHAVPWIGRAAALVALAVALAWPTRWPARRLRQALLLALALWLGVGAVVNGLLKENWGRARPVQVMEFGGTQRFVAAGTWSGECRGNCSFVSGHAATGFALSSLGLLGSLRRRRRWALVGGGSGLLIGIGRIAQGGHFLSDIAFAGLAMWATHLLIRLACLHWRRHRRRSRARRMKAVTA